MVEWYLRYDCRDVFTRSLGRGPEVLQVVKRENRVFDRQFPNPVRVLAKVQSRDSLGMLSWQAKLNLSWLSL